MQLTILGNNSALPNHNRFPTAQVLSVGNELLLIDCGEGTQMRLLINNVRYSRITKIFISHLHGDHYFGLIGLLTRYCLNNRTEPIDLYGPAPLIDIIHLQLNVASSKLTYELRFHPLKDIGTSRMICEQPNLKVTAFPTEHRIECYGFVFEEKFEERKLNIEEAERSGIPVEWYARIKKGEDYTDHTGRITPNELLTFPAPQSKRYVFAADTRYTETFIPVILDCDLLYHETTYLMDHQELAYSRYHSTTRDAACIAKLARTRQLIIGHFSSKYPNLQDFLLEANQFFPKTLLSFEGMKIDI
ncbi:MAG: ribonuclease Z [Taibaiella sp.]|nr:ribonuclease Z [Taibaiella sp.]MBX9449187.1 ribonuclease Z [Taibaiella sp.]